MSAHLQNRIPVRSRVLAYPTIGPRQLWLIALALLTTVVLFASRIANADVAISVNIAPPALPVYEQPVIPAPGYIWVPGYWAWSPAGYYWVPGTWELPPAPGLLWTPGFWAWSSGSYLWTAGYWGPVVGYYGGIDYGYGYPGRGYQGGYWRNNQFYYNRTVNNISNTNITNVYSNTVNNVTVNRVSYHGGPGGTTAQPTAQEQAAARQGREGPTAAQTQHVAAAAKQHDLLASVNHGKPPIAATAKPGAFSGPGVVQARSASGAAAQQPSHLAEAPRNAPPPRERPAPARPGAPAERMPSPQERAAPGRPGAPAERMPPPQERAAPGRPPAPAERMPPPREAAPQQREQREQPRNEEPRPQQQRRPENGPPQA